MTQLQEAIRDKITKYSDACGMCTDTTKDCDACYIPCMLDELNELQKLANRQESMGPTAHWKRIQDAAYMCTYCKSCFAFIPYNYQYCPECGAKMLNAYAFARER